MMLTVEPGVYDLDHLDDLGDFYRRFGFAVLRGLIDDATVAALVSECGAAQEDLVAGRLAERYGTVELVEEDAGEKARRFANYVTHIAELSPTAAAVVGDARIAALVARWLGPHAWSGDAQRFGFVFQDARPGAESSYTRIGWHSDWQSSPHLAMWPSTAVTVHLDATSPANGFLRVVPGSQRWATPPPYENVNGAVVPEGSALAGGYTTEPPPHPMPLRFEKVPGEIALYAEAGDVLFHDGYLWHSAARGTVDGSIRRHVRGSWFGGTAPEEMGPADFVKNAAR
jgi:Phytanoyl-CoA dioxygenase (PhyH)